MGCNLSKMCSEETFSAVKGGKSGRIVKDIYGW